MCSISGFIVTNPSANRKQIAKHYTAILAEGSERGQDSAGVVSLDTFGVARRQVVIAPSSFSFISEVVTPDCSIVIGNNRAEPTTEYVHTKTLDDAQPFGDGTIYVSHNGTIANDNEIRTAYSIETNTRIDSSVCPELIHKIGIRAALKEIRGSFGLSIIDVRQPHKLWLARNYKPLFLQALPELGAVFFASRPNHLSTAIALGSRLRQPPIVSVPPYSLLEINGANGVITEEALADRERDKRALVICSGGLDSTTAARWAQLQGYDVTLLHFMYNCRAETREAEAVRAIALALQCGYRFEDLSWLGRLGGSSITDVSIPVTNNEMSAEFPHEWVPARNLIFTSLAAGLCDRYGFDTLILGLNLEEAGAYPDNTVEFYESLDHVLNIGTLSRPRILCPLANLVKHQIVRLALDIEAPIHLSWSCYYGNERHCGHCGPCYMRRTAFRMVGVEDSVSYETN
ncbi:MAG: 7-cyano-7-deazaguanine synthase QueC [Anaerolineae bacterium]|nr:7-cyano-7-deazaguanine synthase QueC [Anaerolineae bacterium]